MRIDIKASGTMLATTFGGILLASQIVTAPAAQTAPCPGGSWQDPVTGVCWSQNSPSASFGTGGTPCLPGRLGLCMAGLANNPSVGVTSLPGPNRNSSWP